MTPQQSYRQDIEQMMIDCRKRLNEASDRADIREMGRLADLIEAAEKMREEVMKNISTCRDVQPVALGWLVRTNAVRVPLSKETSPLRRV